MKTLLAVLCVFLLAVPAFGQSGRIVFDETEHPFGDVTEGETARHVFTFRNTGDGPLRLKDVRPSCGCTTPEWTRDAVAPGATGRITVAYNSTGRPGTFHKTINVVTDGDPLQITLHIRGNVMTGTLSDAIRQGSLRIDRDVAALGDVLAGVNERHTFRVQNAGERPLRFRKIVRVPDNVQVELPAAPLFSGDVASIPVVVSTVGLSAGQAFDVAVSIETDDLVQPVKSFRLTGQVIDGGTN